MEFSDNDYVLLEQALETRIRHVDTHYGDTPNGPDALKQLTALRERILNRPIEMGSLHIYGWAGKSTDKPKVENVNYGVCLGHFEKIVGPGWVFFPGDIDSLDVDDCRQIGEFATKYLRDV